MRVQEPGRYSSIRLGSLHSRIRRSDDDDDDSA